MSRSQCLGSSPSPPYSSMKEKLKKQIRKLDRELYDLYSFKDPVWRKICPDRWEKLKKLDQKRKEIRFILKSFTQ